MEDSDEADEPNSNSNGLESLDEDGIVNFLEEAIGAEVGTDILREFSHSDIFAEIIEEVLSTSLIPTASSSTSKRQSNQEPKETLKISSVKDSQGSSKSALPSEPGTSSKRTSRAKAHQSVKTTSKKKKSRKSASHLDSDNSDQETSPTENTRTSKNKISDRLKIRLLPSVVKEKKSPKKQPPTKNKKTAAKTTSRSEVSNSTESHPKKRKKNSRTSKTYELESEPEEKLYSTDEDILDPKKEAELKNQFNVKPCSVVVFDIRKLDMMLEDKLCLSFSKSQLSRGTLSVVVSEEKTNDLELIEELAREKFFRRSGRFFDDKIFLPSTKATAQSPATTHSDKENSEDEDSFEQTEDPVVDDHPCADSPMIVEEPNDAMPSIVDMDETQDPLVKVCKENALGELDLADDDGVTGHSPGNSHIGSAVKTDNEDLTGANERSSVSKLPVSEDSSKCEFVVDKSLKNPDSDEASKLALELETPRNNCESHSENFVLVKEYSLALNDNQADHAMETNYCSEKMPDEKLGSKLTESILEPLAVNEEELNVITVDPTIVETLDDEIDVLSTMDYILQRVVELVHNDHSCSDKNETLSLSALDEPHNLEELKAENLQKSEMSAEALPVQSTDEDFDGEAIDSYEDHDAQDDCEALEKENDNDSDELAKKTKSSKPRKPRLNAFALIDSDSESDSDEEIKLRQSSSSRSRVNDDYQSGDSDDGKGQQFGRKRDKDDIRAKKFGKLESERQRKFADKKRTHRGFSAEDPFGQGKTLATSFKIPKLQSYQSYRGDNSTKISTPLAKQDLPELNLKFERCKKGKDGEIELKKDKKPVKHNKEDSSKYLKKTETKAEENFLTYASYKKNKGLSSNPSSKTAQNDQLKIEDVKPEITGSILKNPTKSKRKKYAVASEDSDRLPPPPPSLPEVLTTELESPINDSPLEFDEPQDEDFADVVKLTPKVESIVEGDSNYTSLPNDFQPGHLAIQVAGLIRKGKTDLPTLKDSQCPTQGTAQKCAWWFAKGMQMSNTSTEHLRSPSFFDGDADSDSSFWGYNSDCSADKCQVNEISSTSRVETNAIAPGGDLDPEECCGRSLLTAKIREGTSEHFKNIFDLRPGTTYEKENFQAKCNLCNLLVVGKRDLAHHIRGISHSQKLKDLCEPIMGSPDEEIDDKIKTSKPSESKNPSSDENKGKKTQAREKDSRNKDKEEKKERKKHGEGIKVEKRSSRSPDMEVGRTSTGLKVKVPITGSSRKRSRSPPVPRRRSRSRSKSPIARRRSRSPSRNKSRVRSRSRSAERRRRKSRSPVRRIARSPDKIKSTRRSPSRRDRNHRSRVTTSEERVKEFLARTRKSKSPTSKGHSKRSRRSKSRSKSPQLIIKKDNKEFHEKLALTAEGKWTSELEQNWKLMEAEEAIFKEQFYDLRKKYMTTPEDHPQYGDEWTKFWERRYQEVEALGKDDPESYDYVSEWKEFWTRKLNLLLQDEADIRIKEIKRKYGMDFDTLSKLRKPDISKPKPQEVTSPASSFILQPEVPVSSFIMQQEAVVAPPPPTSVVSAVSIHSGRMSEDFSAKSMSISDGEIDPRKGPPAVPVTIEDFKSNWEALTRAKSVNEQGPGDFMESRGISSNRSDITSSSISSNEFGGFDLVQILRLLSQCEDQLSFLAPKVFDYFKIAEEKELAKRKGSYDLLEDWEFIALLFQCKEKLVTLIRSNLLSDQSLKPIKMTVYALENLLNDPRCQRTKSLASQSNRPNAELEDELTNNPSKKPGEKEVGWKDPRMDQRSKPLPKKESAQDQFKSTASEIGRLMSGFSKEHKKAVARELAAYLIANGRQGMNTADLVDFVGKLLLPPVKGLLKEKERKKQIERERLVLIDPFNTESSQEESKSNTIKVYGVTSQRVVGSALPILPPQAYSLPKGAGVPKLPPSYIANHSNVPPTRINRAGDDLDGRSSPFSCRDYSGNPLAEGRL